MLGANGVVGAELPIAAGAAHALKLQGETAIVVCFFGDGAINRGPFLEGLNWAKVFDLPVLFVCEDNSYSATTRTARDDGRGRAPRRAPRAWGFPPRPVDGNDVVAVDTAAPCRDRRRARRRAGRACCIALTYRMTGHTAVDPAALPRRSRGASAGARPIRSRASRATLRVAGVPEDAARWRRRRSALCARWTRSYAQARDAAWPDVSPRLHRRAGSSAIRARGPSDERR